MDMIIKNGTIVNASGTVKADVGIKDGKVVCISDSISDAECDNIIDASGKLVLPGAIDAHTHLAMPFGGTVSSDDYFAGTRAAACGGTTTGATSSGPPVAMKYFIPMPSRISSS